MGSRSRASVHLPLRAKRIEGPTPTGDSPSIPSGLPPAFLAVGNGLRDALRQYVRDDHVAERKLLSAQFQRPGKAIDYNRYAEAFAVSYLLPNYWKMAHAMQRAAPRDRSDIVDLGSGPGTAAWAALAWIASLPDPPESIDVHLVDRSERCLSLADELSSHVLKSLPPTLRPRINIRQADLRGVLQLPPDSLILLSHVLTEHRNDLDSLLASVMLGRPQGEVLIVEREDDDVWRSIDHTISDWPWSREADQLSVDWYVETLLPGLTRDRGLRTRWMLLSHPGPSPVTRAALRYFEAWRLQDIKRVREIFAAEAMYAHDPFARPLHGRSEIVRYWREKVLTQRNPRIELHTLMTEDTEAIVEWTARFEQAKLAVAVSGVMIIRIDPRTEQIVELREYYHSAKAPMNASDT